MTTTVSFAALSISLSYYRITIFYAIYCNYLVFFYIYIFFVFGKLSRTSQIAIKLNSLAKKKYTCTVAGVFFLSFLIFPFVIPESTFWNKFCLIYIFLDERVNFKILKQNHEVQSYI